MIFIKKLKEKAYTIKTDVVALYFAFKDKRTPLFAKLLILFTISYAFSPIDLIPDLIPVIGYLDDLILLPVFITLCIKIIPANILADCRIIAKQNMSVNKKIGIFMAVFIIFFWGYIVFRLISICSSAVH